MHSKECSSRQSIPFALTCRIMADQMKARALPRVHADGPGYAHQPFDVMVYLTLAAGLAFGVLLCLKWFHG